ncbi:MAG: hypothetical protein H7235_11255 [Bdellovibrionaceae bacterium]|nr:hypothetical protein [Pseudobdellovibrionaceae bacterium]
MNKKTRSKITKTAKIKTAVKNFQKVIETKLGKIKWGKVGVVALFILLTVASHGLLGVKAKAVAVVLFGAIQASRMA